MRKSIYFFLAAFVAAAPAIADEIVFKNGDRLSGTITQADGGKLTIKSPIAGEVKVDMKDVKSFSTDAPIDIRLNDGSAIHDKVASAGEGSIATAGTGTVKAQEVPIGD